MLSCRDHLRRLALIGPLVAGSASTAGAEPTWRLDRTIYNPEPAQLDYFGFWVACSGSNLIVGAPRDDTAFTNAGSAYIFNAATGQLVATLRAPLPSTENRFGWTVAAHGGSFLIAARRGGEAGADTGTAYLFDRSGALRGTFVSPAPGSLNLNGGERLVALSGSLAVIGMAFDDTQGTNAGAVYVFNVQTGALVSTLHSPDPLPGAGFGSAVAIEGSTIVVGENRRPVVSHGVRIDGAGAAYVFNGETGELLATLQNPDPHTNGYFGDGIDVEGDHAIIGAPGLPPSVPGGLSRTVGFPGELYLYDITTGQLERTYRVSADADDLLGWSVRIRGNLIVGGAPYADDPEVAPGDKTYNDGAVYVFSRDTGEILATLRGPTRAHDDWSGRSVDVDGQTIYLGMPGASQVPGGVFVNRGPGTVYVFRPGP